MRLPYLLLSFLILVSCKKELENKNSLKLLPPKNSRTEIKWLTEKTVKLKIDNNLSYSKGFQCDSVIAIDYIGFDGEDFFYPINEKGEYISTINRKQKLNTEQILELSSILGSKKTYENPNIAGCYEPRLAFVYFKNNNVICQTQICLECSQLQSTAAIAGEYGNFNNNAENEFKKLKKDLGFN
ncbi:hypothetical protein ACFSJW_20895 [Flavobacterium artemisiae]|uniref:Lipoprotein n=1 Tax=Flavobacterium artemisiae TaxID=2126556 RepID=A0ABW4HB89_9FLAO